MLKHRIANTEKTYSQGDYNNYNGENRSRSRTFDNFNNNYEEDFDEDGFIDLPKKTF